MAPSPETWLVPTPAGLYCRPADAYIDPVRAVPRAIVSHGHGDHARPGHDAVLATPETLAIMQARLGAGVGRAPQALAYGAALTVGDATIRLLPAGHILGAAQIAIEHAGRRIVVSGDYKRRRDPTCPPFEPQPCDVFVTEATFALPVYRHPPAEGEIGRLLASLALFPERAHVLAVYSLGKCQRLIALLREAGCDRTIHLHPACRALCDVYAAHGVGLGRLGDAAAADAAARRGGIFVGSPAWFRRLGLVEPVIVAASGWLGLAKRAAASGAELPLVVSDHADWDELTATLAEIAPGETWITHGDEDALLHWCRGAGLPARALSLVGRGDEVA